MVNQLQQYANFDPFNIISNDGSPEVHLKKSRFRSLVNQTKKEQLGLRRNITPGLKHVTTEGSGPTIRIQQTAKG